MFGVSDAGVMQEGKARFQEKGKFFNKNAANALEKSVCSALYDLQVNQQLKDLGDELKDLFILAALEVKVAGGRAAIVVFIPYILRAQYRKIQARLVRELEKKFGKTFVFVAQRRILKAPTHHNVVKQQKRPYSRTVTAVHDAIMEDVAFPAEIVGRRIRHKLDGSQVHKIVLNKNEQANFENKVDAFSKIYKKLTGRDAVFSFAH